MLSWSSDISHLERLASYLRVKRARARYFETLRLDFSKGFPFTTRDPGYQGRIAKLWNKHKGKRGFVIGNGPSLGQMDLTKLKDEVTIGSNGIFLKFKEMGFHTTYFTMEDIQQVEDRRDQLAEVKGPVKIYGLHNSYAIKKVDEDTLFANVAVESYPTKNRWKEFYPGFSTDFANIVYLGSTITYINLQLAFFLGLNPVYIIGCDHSYGPLAKVYPPGKIRITPEVFEMLKEAHFIDNYHKVGGTFGIPYVSYQEDAYKRALEVFRGSGREVFNAGENSKLDIFPRVNFDSLF
ncbi:6-hydroxymethylpterin diphosphokinase MptE-like protein [Maricaulis salignorans]|uniref:6-hydroxymethylpterin diphosphokinase MptE-like protein n=1 Tax=Maricaulis salignorans TaxID=144026 RepID=UPI003A93840A